MLIAASALAFISEPAGADPAPLQDGSWFWADQQSPPPNTVSAGLPTPDVPTGDYAVSARGGQSNKESFIHLDMSGFPTSGTVSSFTLTVKEDAAPAGNADAASAKISALPVGDFWAGGAAGNPYGQRPMVLDGPSVPGTRGGDGTWTFDISPIVMGWMSGSFSVNGIALVPASGLTPTDNFEVVWLGSSFHADGSVLEDTSSSSTTSSSSDFSSNNSSSSSSDTSAAPSGTGSTSPSGGDFSSSNFSSPAPLSNSSAPLSSDVAAAAPATPPATTAAAPPQTQTTKRASSSRKSDTTPPWFIWLIAIGFGGLLVGIGLSLGPMGEPAPPRRGSVIRRLERPIGAP